MRFALLGNHPDGVAMAWALIQTGRHEVVAVSAISPQWFQEPLRMPDGVVLKPVADVEEVLADPAVEAVIVASRVGDRPFHLRRALQSERHVLCVHPADESPDVAYEAALIQGDTRKVLFPLLTEFLHPAVARLAELTRNPDGPLGKLQLVEMERWPPEELLFDATRDKPAFPGWDLLRTLGGEIAEVSALTAGEDISFREPLSLAGRYQRCGLFQVSLLFGQPDKGGRLVVTGSRRRATLNFPRGWSGPAQLDWRDESDVPRAEHWEAWDPWPGLVGLFETAVQQAGRKQPRPSWQDAVRALELDDAARRSAERRRPSTLEYQEATEEAGFKGTMTLVGCGLLWVLLLLVVLANWVPAVGWLILPLLGGFLLLQLFQWALPPKEAEDREPRIEDRKTPVEGREANV